MPVDLNSLFQAAPVAQEMGLASLFQDRQAKEAELARTLFQTDADKQKLPGQLETQRLNNSTLSAALPGVAANSSLAEDKAGLSRKTMQQQHDELISGYKFKDRERELKELGMMGERFAQAGAYIKQLPDAVKLAGAKQALGPMWRPEFDNMDIKDLERVLNDGGAAMQQAGNKYRMMMDNTNAKGDVAKEVQSMKNASAAEVARIRASVARELGNLKSESLPNREKVLGGIQQQLLNMPDDDPRKDILNSAYHQLRAEIFEEKLKVAMASKVGNPEIGAVANIPVTPPPKLAPPPPRAPVPPAGPVPVPQPQPQPAPMPAQPAATPPPVPGGMNFVNANEVKSAVKAGKLSREQALEILRKQFGMQ